MQEAESVIKKFFQNGKLLIEILIDVIQLVIAWNSDLESYGKSIKFPFFGIIGLPGHCSCGNIHEIFHFPNRSKQSDDEILMGEIQPVVMVET